MKNKLFDKINEVYLWIYSFVNGLVYYIISKKRTKNLAKLTKEEKKEIKDYWKKYKNINAKIHEFKWFKSKGILDKRIIPEEIWHSDIEPYFNSVFLEKAFQDKNYFEFIVGKENSPETIIHCINNQMLNENYHPIDFEEAYKIIKLENEVVCKASMGTSGGKSIKFISNTENKKNVKSILEEYKGNFVIQKVIKQHPLISKFNADSVNTMRIVTFLYNGNFNYIYGELRFGGAGSRLDNSAAGGSWVLINREGIIQDKFYKYDKITTDMHIDDIYESPVKKGTVIPNWDKVIDILKKTHYKLAHFGIIYWDVSISENGTPIIIEYNLLDSDAYAYQYGIGPFFGELTDEILEKIYL